MTAVKDFGTWLVSLTWWQYLLITYLCGAVIFAWAQVDHINRWQNTPEEELLSESADGEDQGQVRQLKRAADELAQQDWMSVVVATVTVGLLWPEFVYHYLRFRMWGRRDRL